MNINDQKLGNWIAIQRQRYKQGQLCDRKIRLLESIPGWEWNPWEAAWEEGFEQLKKHKIFTQTHVTPDGYKLGLWVVNQRMKCTDPEKRKRLESIPGWSWNPNDDAWEEGFKQYEKYGNYSQGEVTPEGYPLGRWIAHQRQRCTDPEKRKRLESTPGWVWNLYELRWNTAFSQVQKHGIVPASFVTEDGLKLGRWIVKQRDICTDPEKRKRLESIPGWYWGKKNQ